MSFPSHENDSPAKLLSPKEAAIYLGVSPSLIYKMIKNGTLPARRIGEKLLNIKPADLDQVYRPAKKGNSLQNDGEEMK